ncbi:MAG: Coq4 family protein [Actinomycetota bacterium]
MTQTDTDTSTHSGDPTGGAPPPIVDRHFADRFLRAVDRPLDYGVVLLFNDWWAEAPQSAIDAYVGHLRQAPGADEFLAARHLPEPTKVEDLASCAAGTLGHGYHSFIVDNSLMANLGVDYRTFHDRLLAEGALDRLPDDLAYTIVRGFQIHDVLHTLTGFSPTRLGELAQAGFHFAQLQFPYHAMRFAVTTAHLAFVDPASITKAMDAMTDGWAMGRAAENTHFHRWEDEWDTPLDELRERFCVRPFASGA